MLKLCGMIIIIHCEKAFQVEVYSIGEIIFERMDIIMTKSEVKQALGIENLLIVEDNFYETL